MVEDTNINQIENEDDIRPSAPFLTESQILSINNNNEDNPRPSALRERLGNFSISLEQVLEPRYESVVNLHKLWRTSYANLKEITTPPVSTINKDASAPLIREESLINLQNNNLENNFKNSSINLIPRDMIKKVAPTYNCNKCNFNTNKKAYYDQHMRRHLDMVRRRSKPSKKRNSRKSRKSRKVSTSRGKLDIS